MINKRTDNIICIIILLFVPMIYFMGVIAWKTAQYSPIEAAVAKGKHIYFVCFSSALYASSMVGFLLANNKILKIVSRSVSSVCGVILYQEVAYGDRQWTEWSYWLIVVVSLNYFIFYSLIEKYKKRIKHE